jgi:hypothetical protein
MMPGNDLIPIHHDLLVTRGLQDQACLLAQDLPFATAARLPGWHTGEPGVLSATTVRNVVRGHGTRNRALEQGEAQLLTSYGTHGQRLRGYSLATLGNHRIGIGRDRIGSRSDISCAN